MPVKLQNNPTVRTLARDLGLRDVQDPVGAIKEYCHRHIRRFLREFKDCNTLAGLLAVAAQRLGTTFFEVQTDDDVRLLVQQFVARREPSAGLFEKELIHEVYGITFKLINPGKFDLPYISIIDCRDSKRQRAYFTKWHELGHLLILTDQRRIAFKRTHTLHELKSPEESIVDIIAGEFAYYAPFVRQQVNGPLNFEAIDRVRDSLCPEGSYLSALFGLVKVWSTPCVLIEAKWARKQSGGGYALRAVHVVVNDEARRLGVKLHRNFRIPKCSLIHQVFEGALQDGTTEENLDWWESSEGSRLGECPVSVSTRKIADTVYALMIPL